MILIIVLKNMHEFVVICNNSRMGKHVKIMGPINTGMPPIKPAKFDSNSTDILP